MNKKGWRETSGFVQKGKRSPPPPNPRRPEPAPPQAAKIATPPTKEEKALSFEEEEIQEELRLLREELRRRLDAAVCPGCRELIDSALECLDGETADECIEIERDQGWDEVETAELFRIHKDEKTCARCRAEIEKTLGGVPIHD